MGSKYDPALMIELGGELNALLAASRALTTNSADRFHPEVQPAAYRADLSILREVASVGSKISAHHPEIDVLVNNAGLHAFTQRKTREGFSEMVAVNYFAPWVLTKTLLSSLTARRGARIVTVGSEASRQSGGLNPEVDLLDTSPFSMRGSSRLYGKTKLMDIMFSLELSRQLVGTGTDVNCLDPGFNVTGLGRELGFAKPLAHVFNWMGIGDPQRGAGIIVKLASDPFYKGQTGLYLSNKGKRLSPFPPGGSEETRLKLWNHTSTLLSEFT